MRIIAGTAKGKKLAVFTGQDVRPTPDRVREALFSILFSRFGSLEGKSVLDLFAGTGALAIEALSRGAARAVLVDRGPQAAKVLPANLAACRVAEKAEFLRAEVPVALKRLSGDTFDLIFLDPPYACGLVPETLELLSRLRLLGNDGVICAEAGRRDEVPETCGDLVRIDRRDYGITSVHLFSHPTPEA